jgi:prevent-host-death family protein
MDADTWTVADAKAKSSKVIEKSRVIGPRTVTRNGRPAVVVVSAEEWERKIVARAASPRFLRTRRCVDRTLTLPA